MLHLCSIEASGTHPKLDVVVAAAAAAAAVLNIVVVVRHWRGGCLVVDSTGRLVSVAWRVCEMRQAEAKT